LRHVAIFSLEQDLHAHTVAYRFRERDNVVCHFVATDALVESGGMVWRPQDSRSAEILTASGDWVNVADLDLVWWRRVNQPQKDCALVADPITKDYIDNEWRSGLFGLMHEAFRGRWVNDPARDLLAGNKLYQLRAAVQAGLRVPRTLVSQVPEVVRDFCRECNGRVVVKKLLGTAARPLATVVLTLPDLSNDQAIRLCPAIYQEVVDGTQHIRANCFGRDVHSILIESDVLDWRRDLSVPFSPIDLGPSVDRTLTTLIDMLGLRMGIMDLMIDRAGDLVWLELNPQGQFLFGEALSGRDLTGPFVDFLAAEAAA
jgi:hypothetical protein